jgi:hypothetical protein
MGMYVHMIISDFYYFSTVYFTKCEGKNKTISLVIYKGLQKLRKHRQIPYITSAFNDVPHNIVTYLGYINNT